MNPPRDLAGEPSQTAAADAAERRMRELLAQQKWRQARNDLKGLAKGDPARFLPLLIDANLGLARQMLAEGQTGQARQVLAYLATIAPAERLQGLAQEVCSGAPAPPDGLAALAAASAADRGPLADALVLTFRPTPASGPGQAALAEEWAGVHRALEAISGAAWTEAAEALRAVPRQSPFAPWAAFAKGLIAFHRGEPGRAAELWRRLPPGSAPAKAAAGYELLLMGGAGGPGAGGAAEPAVAALCRLAGAPGAGGILLRADRLWREGRHRDSYQAARSGFPHFPSVGLDWRGVLSEFYFKAPHGLPEAAWSAYLQCFAAHLDRFERRQSAETMYILRMLCLFGRAVAPPEELREDWEGFLRQHEALHGRNPQLASLAYGWLGDALAAVVPGRFGRRARLRDPDGAVAALRRSVELDPGNVRAHLRLCEVLGVLKRRVERNRLLNQMAERFPGDKDVLLRAAEGCLERKAFGKGLGYLARARACDQLDPRIPERTVAALAAQACQHFQRGRPEWAREAFAAADRWLTEAPEDFRRARWTALARRGLMERRWGDPAEGAALLGQARERAPSPAIGLLFAHLVDREHRQLTRVEGGLLDEAKDALRAAPRVGEIARALRLLREWQEEHEDPPVDAEETVLAGALKGALDAPFTQAEAAGVVERWSGSARLAPPLRELVKRLLRADPANPRARLWELELAGPRQDEAEARRELEAIVGEAARRADEAALRGARRRLRELEPPPDPFDEAEDPGPGLEGLDLPPELETLLDTVRGLSEADMRKALRRRAPKGLPDFLIDALVAVAQGQIPDLSPPRRGGGAPKRPWSDPDQLDFF